MNTEQKAKNIGFSIPELITYAAMLITFGASIYTFFQAIPKIDKLNEISNSLDKNVAVSQVKIERLIQDVQNLQKGK